MEVSTLILFIVFTIWCNLVYSQSPILSAAGKEKICRKPIIEITVSPLISRSSLRKLDISWDLGDQWIKGDWIALYNVPPDIGVNPLYKIGVSQSVGWVRTDVQEGRSFQENPNFNKICLGFWAAYWRARSTLPVTWSCLSTNPRWMGDSKKIIRSLKLNDMFIPGTHDSAAFQLAYSPFIETRLNKYVFAQDESILEQLIHGARYLDFRIGYYQGIWWLNHGIVKVHPLEHVLDDIRLFLNSTQEIVVIDVHGFPVGFRERETHHKLVDYLRKELGSYIAPPWLSWNANLGQLWDRNKRLILAYNDRRIVAEYTDMLWWPIAQKWADVRSLDALYTYLERVLSMYSKKAGRNQGLAWSAMAELTPDAWSIISDKYQGLRNMADVVNHNVTEWFRGDWGGACNAVAVDFIRSTGIVDAAIRWNLRRATRSNCDP